VKKILFITSTFRKGGLTNVLYNLANHLDKSVFDVSIVILSPEPDNTDIFSFKTLNNVTLIHLNLSRIKGIFRGVSKTQKIVDKLKPDIIHSHGIRADGILSKIKTNARKVATIHGFIDEDYIMSFGKIKGTLMYKTDLSYLRQMSVCVGCSQAVADYVKQKFGLQNTVGIPNGIETLKYFAVSEAKKIELRKKLSIPTNAVIWLSSGKFTYRKQPLFMIKQWLLYKVLLKEHHLYILGTGEQYNECLELSKGYDNIHLPGRVDNVDEYLKAGDYYISASKSEGFSMAILEAAACGLPLLLTDIPQFKEVLYYNKNMGLNFKLDDSGDFITKLQEMINFDKKSIQSSIIETIKNEFSAQKMTERYVKEYLKN